MLDGAVVLLDDLYDIGIGIGIGIGDVSTLVFSRSIGSVLEVGQEGRISFCRVAIKLLHRTHFFPMELFAYMYIHIVQQTFVYIFDLRSIATTAFYFPLGNLGVLGDLFDF